MIFKSYIRELVLGSWCLHVVKELFSRVSARLLVSAAYSRAIFKSLCKVPGVCMLFKSYFQESVLGYWCLQLIQELFSRVCARFLVSAAYSRAIFKILCKVPGVCMLFKSYIQELVLGYWCLHIVKELFSRVSARFLVCAAYSRAIFKSQCLVTGVCSSFKSYFQEFVLGSWCLHVIQELFSRVSPRLLVSACYSRVIFKNHFFLPNVIQELFTRVCARFLVSACYSRVIFKVLGSCCLHVIPELFSRVSARFLLSACYSRVIFKS